jgi:Protein of unknown function (DUF2911)
MLPTTRPALLALTIVFVLCRCGTNQPSPPPNEKKRPKDTMPSIPVQSRIPSLDKSVMDMTYYPGDYPVLKMSHKVKMIPYARVIYSRPFRDGREIFGNVVKYGMPWRLGANEATEIEFFRNVKIMGKRVNKGRYVIYCIPDKNIWTIIFNNDLYTWGLKIDQRKDQYRFQVPITLINVRYEVFTMEFETLKKGFALNIAWDNVHASLPINDEP